MIIGISGLVYDKHGNVGSKSAGKDTAADHLVGKYNFVKIGFADVFKRFLEEVVDYDPQQLFGPSAMRDAPDSRHLNAAGNPVAPRELLVALGEALRVVYPDIWVKYAMRIAKTVVNPRERRRSSTPTYTAQGGLKLQPYDKFWERQHCCFSDVRRYNEFAHIQAAGGFNIRVKRRVERIENPSKDPTEVDLAGLPDSSFVCVIEAEDGNLDQLRGLVDQVMAGLIPYEQQLLNAARADG